MKKLFSTLLVGSFAAALCQAALAAPRAHHATHTPPSKSVLSPDDRSLGSPTAPITVIEYAAPTCPHCADFNAKDFPQLKQTYIDTGKVLFIFRVYPLGPADGAVEGIARCLPKERYFPYLDMMFREQRQWDPDGYDIPDVEGAIVGLAASEGLSAEKVHQCIADKKTQSRINSVANQADKKYHVDGVPEFVINGKLLTIEGKIWPELQAKLDAILANP